jgi:hypothetical protein
MISCADSADFVDEEEAANSLDEGEQDKQIKAKKVPRASMRKTRAGTARTKSPAKVLQCGCTSICSFFLLRIPLAGIRLDEEGLELLEQSHDLH